MTVNSIPIYWGNPLICKEFNTKSFVSFYEADSWIAEISKLIGHGHFNQMIEYIIELDKDLDKYLEVLKTLLRNILKN